MAAPDHGSSTTAPPAPLRPPAAARRRSPGEEARTLLAGQTLAALATLTADGDPWAAHVAYGLLPDGGAVILVSTLSEHGRQLREDPRASLLVAEPADGGDTLDTGRVTLAGIAVRPAGDELAAARAAYFAAVPAAEGYADFGDFAFWVLRPRRVRWVGGFARMGWAEVDDYARAEPDPVAPIAARAARHMDADHADALVAMARGPAGFSDATAATCLRADRYGLDLWVTTPRGDAGARVGFERPCAAAADLRPAAVELTRRARAAA